MILQQNTDWNHILLTAKTSITGEPPTSDHPAHALQIKRGRYTNTPKEDRKCTRCGVIEDELHFLDNCIKFENLRSRLIKDICKHEENNPDPIYGSQNTIYSNLVTYFCRMTGRCASQNMCMTVHVFISNAKYKLYNIFMCYRILTSMAISSERGYVSIA